MDDAAGRAVGVVGEARLRFGDYELEGLIGRGGMAEVFRARARKGPYEGRTVAIKRLLPTLATDPAYVDMFVSEADVSRQLRHEAIVPVLGTGVVDDTYYIVMDFIDGHDMGKLLAVCAQRGIKLPIDVGCYVAHVVAQALDYAHNVTTKTGQPLGIVHCDVTPSNLFISRYGEVRLGDFGVAHTGVIGRELGAVAGKASYLSPEQIAGETVTPATDVFALGAILFEMLTGRKAFLGETVEEIFEHITDGDVPRPSTLRPDISPALDAVVMRALCVHLPASSNGLGSLFRNMRGLREARYGSAKELAQAIAPLYDAYIGTGLALASMLKGLLGKHLGGF